MHRQCLCFRHWIGFVIGINKSFGFCLALKQIHTFKLQSCFQCFRVVHIDGSETLIINGYRDTFHASILHRLAGRHRETPRASGSSCVLTAQLRFNLRSANHQDSTSHQREAVDSTSRGKRENCIVFFVTPTPSLQLGLLRLPVCSELRDSLVRNTALR